jgi:hypothetical protein
MCDCKYCQLARRINAEKANWNAETLAIVKELWNGWEHAEMELCYLEAKNKPIS